MRCALLCGLIVLASQASNPPQPPAAVKTNPAANASPAIPRPPSPQGARQTEDLSLQYARARLQLAQANLARISAMNKRLERSVPASIVAQYRHDVSEAELQVQHAARQSAGYDFGVWLSRAEGEQQAAVTRWKNAVAGNERLKGSFDETEVARFRLQSEVLRLLVERGRSLAGATPLAQLQWQAELLDFELDQQQEESRNVAPFVRTYPLWW